MHITSLRRTSKYLVLEDAGTTALKTENLTQKQTITPSNLNPTLSLMYEIEAHNNHVRIPIIDWLILWTNHMLGFGCKGSLGD